MAKSNSFNKRELEKKKQKKRQEKLQKKEERKASGGATSFEDMIAYVDENGMITDTPPDPSKKEEIELEDISISVPKRTEDEEPTELTGYVDFYDESRGFGFIKEKDSVNKYFFHRSHAPEGIKENNHVSFELERGLKGLNAINIQFIK